MCSCYLDATTREIKITTSIDISLLLAFSHQSVYVIKSSYYQVTVHPPHHQRAQAKIYEILFKEWKNDHACGRVFNLMFGHAAADCLSSWSSRFKACNSFGHDSGIPPGSSNSKSFPCLRQNSSTGSLCRNKKTMLMS